MLNHILKEFRIFFISLFLVFSFTKCDAQPSDESNSNGVIDTFLVLKPEENHFQKLEIINRLLERYSFRKVELNDSISSLIFDDYISSLDDSKLYFYQSDIDSFENFRYEFDNFLINGQLELPFHIFNAYKTRLYERMQYVKKRLQTEFDYTKDEEFCFDRRNENWAKTKEELDEIWRKKLKNETLSLKLRGKDWASNSETVLKRYTQFHRAILQYKNEDLFELFMNIYTNVIDAHTNYFSPEDSENFKISMSLSLEGIGAQLRSEDDYVTIVGIVPGGPAYKSGKLKEGDRIVAVAQGEKGEYVDIIGWRTDEAVKLIRGDKGTKVRLLILPADANIDAKPFEITLVREKIKLEDQAAQKDTIYIYKDNRVYTFGVVKVPAFYLDFEGKRKNDPDYKSTTKDVKRIVEEFKKEGIDGVIVDLRNNGGGSLIEAVELAGLFIDSGPVVQVKNSDGIIEVDRDVDNSITWDGPLMVMVNKNSASASEIFSAAIQDYGRGIIVGEQTYGKGTVQNLIDLSRFVPVGNDDMGQLKITVAKFYRITGGSTQHKGVIPDIEFPTRFSPEEVGESSNPSALPWDQIPPTKFKPVNDLSNAISHLIQKHKERIKNNIEFQFLLEDIEEYKKNKDIKTVSLQEEKRIKERDEQDAQKKLRDEQRQQKLEMNINNVPEINIKKTKKDDYLLQESGEILGDFISLTKK